MFPLSHMWVLLVVLTMAMPEVTGGSTGHPVILDWRTQGLVGPVGNQGDRDTGWAFAVTGALEAQQAKVTGQTVVPLSEQNVVDCVNDSCTSHTVCAFKYVMENGISTKSSYPSTTQRGRCRSDRQESDVSVVGYHQVTPQTEDALRDAVTSKGPVTARIYSGPDFRDTYRSGIHRCPVGSLAPNHVVLVIGYGTNLGTDYWLIKNSYGEDWGMNGYAKIVRNSPENCGILSSAFYPEVSGSGATLSVTSATVLISVMTARLGVALSW